MAVTVITPEVLTLDTRSSDLPDASGTVAPTPTDGWTIDVTGYKANRVLLKFLADGTGDTVTILAGDYPPAARQGLGNISIVLAASDVRYVVVESARVMQSDSTYAGMIRATCVDAGTMCWAMILPADV